MVHSKEPPRPVVLTGGIGSGKSSVARLLREWGAHVVDADVLAREVVSPGSPGLAAVVAEFGAAVLAPDDSLDRAALAERVFADRDRLSRLEAIIHPLVHAAAVEQVSDQRGAVLVVYEVPLPGSSPFADEPVVVVVDAPEQIRRERLLRRGLSDAQILARTASQPTREKWLTLADWVLDNSGSEETLTAEVARLWRELTGEDPPVGAGG